MTHNTITDELSHGSMWLDDLREDCLKVSNALADLHAKATTAEYRKALNTFIRNAKENMRGFLVIIESYPEKT